MPTPFRKSRRVMARSRPSARSDACGAILGRFRGNQFGDRPMGLVDRLVRVSRSRRIRIRDRDSTEPFAPDLARRLPLGPIRVPKRVVFVGVAMGPAIDGNRVDIACRIELPVFQHTRQLITNAPLEGLKRGREQVDMAGALLIPSWQAGLAR